LHWPTAARTLLCDESCLRELRTVLRYAKFGLDEAQAAVLYGEYCARIEMLPLPESRDTTQPRCRDREDQKFFDLAVRAGADLLVSRDRALLRLGRHRLCPPHLRVLAPPALCAPARSIGRTLNTSDTPTEDRASDSSFS
jgi:predicted nucleic acid-binding protein